MKTQNITLNRYFEAKNNEKCASSDTAPLGAGEGISGVLQNLFNDNSDEAKLLAYQLQLLKNHLEVTC